MQYVAETGVVKFYDDDKLIAESHDCFSKEIKLITITQNNIDIAMKITTRYEFKRDTTDGKWYVFADGIKVCEASF